MSFTIRARHLALLACAATLFGCATKPATPPAAASPANETAAAEQKSPAGQKRYKWTKASEAEVAKTLDEKFQEAAKAYVQVKRDDQLMFCKRYREMGSNIRTLHCITEAELRKQVEDSDQLRDQMRQRMGRCDLTGGCGAGPDPASRIPLPQQ